VVIDGLPIGLTVSLDELAIGFALGLSRVPVVAAVLLIAGQAFLVSQLGSLWADESVSPFEKAPSGWRALPLSQ
jgi:putative Mn2+ efflux pump MntP